jgi:universal stress protein A
LNNEISIKTINLMRTAMGRYNKVLLATDFHSDNKGVIAAAVDAASDAELFVVHVTEPMASLGYGSPLGAGGDHIASIQLEANRHAGERMSALATELHIPSSRTHLREGRAAHEIHALAQEIGADLIVLGTHGQHGIRLLLGSTANSVLHGVDCDVLVVRLKGS